MFVGVYCFLCVVLTLSDIPHVVIPGVIFLTDQLAASVPNVVVLKLKMYKTQFQYLCQSVFLKCR